MSLQGIEEQVCRPKGQTVEIAVGAEPNATDGVGLSAGRGHNIANDEGRQGVPGSAGRSVQKVRTMVDHAVVGDRAENTAVGVAAVRPGHVLPQRFVAQAFVQRARPRGQLYRS